MNSNKQLFIAFEGIDGSGKSTHSRLLTEHLQADGIDVYTTCEPSKGDIGLMIRSILKGEKKADHKVLAGLFVADRLDHILNENDGILKQLAEGKLVISDRYYFSSYAYHSTHMDMDWVIEANSLSADILRPTITIFVDVAPDICMKRIHDGRENTELFETLDILTAIRANYFTAFQKLADKETVFIVDGNRDMEIVANEIYQKVKSLL
jgi:dTMP kinase